MSKIEDEVCNDFKSLDGIDDFLKNKICDAILSRASVGEIKYGVTLERDDLEEVEWLIHLQEELMDAVNYATRIQHISDAHKEDLLFNELKGYLFYFITQVQKLIELETFYADEENMHGTEV